MGIAATTLAAPTILKFHGALAQDKPATLNVRSWGGVWLEALRRGVSGPFSEETGIGILHDLTEDYLTVIATMDAIEHGRTPSIHVNWNTTINATRLADSGMTENLGDLAGIDALMPIAHPMGFDDWPLVNTYSYVYALAYRDAAFPDDPPDSWHSMVDPQFRGRVALFDDGIGFFSSAQVAGGGTLAGIPDDMAPCWSFLERVRDNRPLLGEDPDLTQWLQNGDTDVACAVTADARAARLNGAAVSWTLPRESAEYDTDAMVIPVGLPENELYWAKRYVERAISAEGQLIWCNGLGLPPVYPGLAPPPDLVGDPTYPTVEADFSRLLRIPTQIQVAHQDDWFARFQRIMGEG